MMEVFLESALLLSGYATLWFCISIIIRRNDYADIAWGLGYVVLCAYHASVRPLHPVLIVCYLLILIWGIRLSVFLYQRNSRKTEDFRYLQWRKEWGKTFYWRSYLQVYLLKAFFLLVIISPVLFAVSVSTSSWSWYMLIGGIVWSIGFYWQSVGDYQLRQFIRQRKSKDEVLQTGLWRYSRHPNYFGEVIMWWGIYLVIWPLSGSWLFIIGPLTITVLIRYVSGVPMLERRYAKNQAFQEYKKRVPVLVPGLRP